MYILGIETSCDETSVAVVKNGREILSNIISSQITLHRKTGGVVPEVAAREHVTRIIPVIQLALKKAKKSMAEISAIAVTAGPGLLSSLLIGVNTAMTLALIHKKPLIPVNHIEGHVYANWLEQPTIPQFPAAVLTVSGGHNELLIWKNHGEYKFLGATLDDAAGEAFDKVARLLGLPYPGGPEIQRAAERGDPTRYPLPRAWLDEKHQWDFSFSGLKTAVLYLVKKHRLTSQFAADVAASFQESVCEVLATKLARAAQKYRVNEVHLAGGVSANTQLRKWVRDALEKAYPKPSPLKPQPSLRFCTDLTLCTDNAAMIAAAGYFKFKKNQARFKTWRPIEPDPSSRSELSW